ncbi:MAG: hypothetical protein JXR83_09255 [Deltaproteobacteria bacterium]|nr:hypothetical protein [Deltaproteobacteria bacterium]
MSRGWQIALAAASAALVLVVVAAIAREARAPWRQRQEVLRSRGVDAPGTVVEVQTAFGVERCLTCHFDLAAGTADRHPGGLRDHPPFVVGCVGCHGGDGRALDPQRAHFPRGRHRLEDRAWRAARCALCHVPGTVDDGGVVARGLLWYEDLGCVTCHRSSGSTQAADRQGGYGPDLDDSGRLEPATLSRLLRDPLGYFGPDTKMPAFAAPLEQRTDVATPLISFLLTLRGDLRRPLALGDARQPCAGCHWPEPARGLQRHRCSYIDLRRDELRCARCHAAAAAAAVGAASQPQSKPRPVDCLYIGRLRSTCGVCHRVDSGTGGVADAR